MKPVIPRRGLKNSNIRKFNDMCARRDPPAINLAQGLCHVEPSPEKDRANEAYKRAIDQGKQKPGYDTYVSYKGIEPLRKGIANKAKAYNGLDVDPDREVIVTAGALGAFHCALQALLRAGDEVILFQPFYSFHKDQLDGKDMVTKAVTLRRPDWSFSYDDLLAAWTPRTKAVLVNTPANPCGKVFDERELNMIARFCIEKNLFVFADEVYEFMVFDDQKHISIARLPGMWERTVTMWSFGKMLGATGWRLGSAVGDRDIIQEMGYYNEHTAACGPAPAQWAVAAVIDDLRPFQSHQLRFQEKRDILCDALDEAGFSVLRPGGAMYVQADVTHLMPHGEAVDSEVVTCLMIEQTGVGSVPSADFYTDESGRSQIRYCYGTTNDQLHEAARRLRSLRTTKLVRR